MKIWDKDGITFFFKFLDKTGLTYFYNKVKDIFALLDSPALGAPHAPTPDSSANNTQIATAAFYQAKKSNSATINKSDVLVEAKDLFDNATITNTVKDGSASVAKSGYTPIMIVGFRIRNASSNGAGSSSTWAYRLYLNISTSTVYYSLRAKDDITAKVRLSVYVLYCKN